MCRCVACRPASPPAPIAAASDVAGPDAAALENPDHSEADFESCDDYDDASVEAQLLAIFGPFDDTVVDTDDRP